MADFFAARGPAEWCEYVRDCFRERDDVRLSELRTEFGSVLLGFRAGEIPWSGGTFEVGDWSGAWMGARQNVAESLGIYRYGAETLGAQIGNRLRESGLSGIYDLHGPLAVATYNSRTEILHALRDKLGRIPIQYTNRGGNLFATSDSEWLLAVLKEVRNRPDRLRAFFSPGSRASREDFLEHCFRVLPREHLRWRASDGEPTAVRYWRPETEPVDSRAGVEDLKDEIDRKISRSLEKCDPSGDFVALSGGIDSTYLAARFRDLYPERRIETASMVCRRSEMFDERHRIVETSETLELDHHLFDVSELWPLKEIAPYRRRIGDGPNGFALELSETAFSKWVRERLGGRGLIFGLGAEFAFRSPVAEVIRANIGSYSALMEIGCEPGVGLRRILKELVKRSLGAAGMRSKIRDLRDKSVDEPTWRDSENWLNFSPVEMSPETAGMTPGQPGDESLSRLDRLSWEITQRGTTRLLRHSELPHCKPYLDEKLLESALRLPYVSRVDKSILRELVGDRLPPKIAERSYEQRMNPLVVYAYSSREFEKIVEMFSPSQLGQSGLLADEIFRAALDELRREAHTNGIDAPTGTFGIWLTVAAEIWMRSLPQTSPE